MEFHKGKRLKYQPEILQSVLYSRIYSDEWHRLIDNREEIRQWCNANYGAPIPNIRYNYFGNPFIEYTHNWLESEGKKYQYFFFKTKDDALQFKLVWG